MSDNEYTVYFECHNCKYVYLVFAPKGTELPTMIDCPRCEVQRALRKTGFRSSFDNILNWDGKNLEYRK